MILKFYVKHQTLYLLSRDPVVADSSGYLQANFQFTDDWAGTDKTAQFKRTESTLITDGKPLFYDIAVDSDGNCTVPWEVLVGEGTFNVNVYGQKTGTDGTTVKTITVNSVDVPVGESGLTTGETPLVPTKSKYESMYEAIVKTETNVETIQKAVTTSEQNAKTSETNAAASETAAKASETAAKASETNAATSATESANSAKASATSAANASNSESRAAADADEAADRRDDARDIMHEVRTLYDSMGYDIYSADPAAFDGALSLHGMTPEQMANKQGTHRPLASSGIQYYINEDGELCYRSYMTKDGGDN